jgi:hypothetical protein
MAVSFIMEETGVPGENKSPTNYHITLYQYTSPDWDSNSERVK